MNINTTAEIARITSFLQSTYRKAHKNRALIAWSGGIDSTVSLYLLVRALPKESITVLHLPYRTSYQNDFASIQQHLDLPSENFHVISIVPFVDAIWSALVDTSDDDHVRKGNIMARIRMVVLYDWAKKLDALVCGTENKTEDLLGYFTRFGDAASDVEPIQHLYKTQVKSIARTLQVPATFIERHPTAGLWDDQTDEGEFGFTYKEADEVLLRIFEYSESITKVEKDCPNTKKIIALAKKNAFKHEVPYTSS